MYKNINNCPPNGESFSQLQARVINVLNKVKVLEQEKVAVVCHGGVIRSLLAHLLSTPLENTRIFDIHYVGFVKFIKNNEGWRLAELNSGFKK
jgi:broad specificity phosphatase PhoE